MRIVFVSDHYANSMGYIENILPRELVGLGAEVHLITSKLRPYEHLNSSDFERTYSKFAQTFESPAIADRERVHFHYLPHNTTFGYMRLRGLIAKLGQIRPDIVQTFDAISWTPLLAALGRPVHGYRLFTGNHTTASIFKIPERRWSKRYFVYRVAKPLCGKLVSLFSEKCFAATKDCAEVAVRFYGVQEAKVETWPLGVDTELFFPSAGENGETLRRVTRAELGISDRDLLCIYTGRFTDDKNPLLLARAIEQLSQSDNRWRGLFFGDGPQKEAIRSCAACIVRPFVPFGELGGFYRAADIGVWPTQESTSMIDCAACGIPIVVNDTLAAKERIEGNGLTYRLNDLSDLIKVIKSLDCYQMRKQLGEAGSAKMKAHYSWRAIARRRLVVYQEALVHNRRVAAHER